MAGNRRLLQCLTAWVAGAWLACRLLQRVDGQASLALTLQTTCPPLKFFDISDLQCADCPAGAFPDSSQRVCISCDGTSGASYDFRSGLAISQTWSSALLQSTTSCACQAPPAGATAVIAQAESAGMSVQRCVVCPSGTVANSIGQCAPTDASLSLPPTPSQQLTQAMSLLGVSMTASAATQAFLTVPSASGVSSLQLTVQQSQPLVDLLGPSALACRLGMGADREACNAVANLCALTLYDSASAACRLYTALVNLFRSNTVSSASPPPPPGTRRGTAFRPETGAMPWLLYEGSGYTDDRNMDLRVKFSGGSVSQGKVSMFTFVLSSYLLNGTWLGYSTWTSEFQLCGAPKNDGSRWYRFGWNYDNSCQIKLEALLAEVAAAFTGAGDTVLHELYLQVGTQSLYPIPVKITNKDELDGNNQADSGAVRRFFYVDRRLGYSSQARALQGVQYPVGMQLDIVLRRSPRDSIYVPQLTVTYGAWQTNTLSAVNLDSAAANEMRDTSFRVIYSNEYSLNRRFWYAWQTVMIVFEVVFAFPAMLLAVYKYIKKKREQADLDFLVYAGVCIADFGSFTLAMVLLVVSLYYLIIYKLQEEVYFLMLQDSDLQNFRITVTLAIVGQSLGLVWMVWGQIRTDVFFIDWEKGRKILTKDGTHQDDAPVSAWRMLMVANEFNELQTVRVTSPGFTMLMMVMILEGANVIASGAVTPDANDYKNYANVTTSIILRFGVEVFFLLVLFLGQYLFKRLIYFPYFANPVTQFIDLMFLANISTVILDDTHSGYYIHGRNQLQHSDTTLRDLNQELLKEEEGLTAQRGLVSSSSNPKLADNQLFLMYITDTIRKTYDAKMLQLVQQATNDSRMRKGTIRTFLRGSGRQRENVLSAQQEITLLFKQMIDDVERNQAAQVVDPTYLQMAIQLPPDNSVNNPSFVHDYLDSFTRTMFLGHEVRLYVYEALFFCAIDMNIRSVAVSALITYIMVRVVRHVRASFGEDNLSQKTLVDRHFLI
ncbi:hypothetical protein GPECTOR_36g81 [Gonium pectorale]|uniref:Meckelin n=1 Tax=Gonium pectorale TaxID=33097 RepID=A0A150GC06_GONPE|nr:hypothetical protein GPECTOR_36g81 [Gonium pectorale]|eukprot:KXZ47359.1 hypothetical protein GPECTOR_36g81 [Gonium pectorale]